MLKEKFNETTNYMIITSVLTFFVGLTMMFFPVASIATVGIIAAIYFIAYGIFLIYMEFNTSKYNVPFDGLFSGVISILIGSILLCLSPKALNDIFGIIIGIWMILSSINLIKVANKLSNTKLPWKSILVLGILDLIIGILVVFNPFASMISITLFAGIMIMVHSVINIIDVIIIKKDVQDISKELKKKLSDITK
ncbi:MAG: DUF308 domain-containing protein [Bacilli bacterium]|nr:DUF308 domain-containing protein [Bacilli bacterium]MBR3049623.1 DUF308 domain-containing protein [Bacilli bacterium]